MSKKVSIYDLAKALGVSPATVSRSLNNNDNISKATKQRVFAMAKKMGYGRAFKYKEAKSVSKLIALVIPSIDSNLYVNLTKEMQRLFSKLEYNLVIFTTNNNYKEEVKIAQQITQLNPSAALVCLSDSSEDANSYKVLNDYNIPWLMFDQVDYSKSRTTISSNNIFSSKKVIDHLAMNGFKRIAHLAGHPNSNKYNEIVEGYIQGLKGNNIKYKPEYLIYSDLSKEDINESLYRLLSLEVVPNAIFVASAEATIEVLHFLNQNSIEIGKDIALVSYGFDKALKYNTPSISHIEINSADIAKSCVNNILMLIENDKTKARDIKVNSKFIIRKSTLNI